MTDKTTTRKTAAPKKPAVPRTRRGRAEKDRAEQEAAEAQRAEDALRMEAIAALEAHEAGETSLSGDEIVALQEQADPPLGEEAQAILAAQEARGDRIVEDTALADVGEAASTTEFTTDWELADQLQADVDAADEAGDLYADPEIDGGHFLADPAGGGEWQPGEEPLTDTGGMETWLAGAEAEAVVEDAAVTQLADGVCGVEADTVTAGAVDEEARGEQAVQTVAGHDVQRKLPAVDLAEGTVLTDEEIREMVTYGHRSPERVWGSGLEQARQALAWGYDGFIHPSSMAPDAREEDWATVNVEELAARAAAATAAEVAAAGGMDDQVPDHVPTPEEWKAIEERAAERTRPAAARPLAANPGQGDVVLDLTVAELALAWSSLGRFGYRAFDSWGDQIAPFDYDSGEALPEPATLTGKQGQQLHKALVEHADWAGQAKKPNPEKIAAVVALADKVEALLKTPVA